MSPSKFRYPRAGLLLARLLLAMGFGAKSWAAKNGRRGRTISASTFQRIARDEPVAFALRDFIDDALGLLGSPSGRWQFGTATMDRSAVFEHIFSALRTYDKSVSELNGCTSLVGADSRHALPILTLVAIRLGAFAGLAASLRGEPLDKFWERTPLDPGAFGRAVARYAEAAMPGVSWRERGEASPVGKNTLDRWRTTPPNEHFKFASLTKFAGWVANRIGGDAASIEWHLRWLAAGARLHGSLTRYLGHDDHGEPWANRIIITAMYHARLNYEIHRDGIGLDAALQWLDPDARKALSPDDSMAVRRVFAWSRSGAREIDLHHGPALSEDEMLELRAQAAGDEAVRRGLWARLGLLHALGLPAPGYMEALAHQDVLDQYSVHRKHPSLYLKLQHDIIFAHLENADGELAPGFIDDHIASSLKLIFMEDRAHAFLHQLHVRAAPTLADPAKLKLALAGVHQLVALQRSLAGDPTAAALAPVTDTTGDPKLRGLVRLLELHRILPQLAAAGDENSIVKELETTLRDYPEMVEPAFWLVCYGCEKLLDQEEKRLANSARLQILLAPSTSFRSGSPHHRYRELIALRRESGKLQQSIDAFFVTLLATLDELAGRSDDHWAIDLAACLFSGRRAARYLIWRRRLPFFRLGPLIGTAAETLRMNIASLLELHASRPDHPEPCLWLARFYAALGDREASRHWARRSEQRGEPEGLKALELIDD